MRRHRAIRLLAAMLAVSCGAALSGGADARPDAPSSGNQLPRGWWAGTIVVRAEWDRIEAGSHLSARGSATFRVGRTELDRASYELEYAEEWRWLESAPDRACRGKLLQRMSSSWRATGQIQLVYQQASTGVSFFVQPRSGANFLLAPLTGQEFRDCETGQGGEPYDAGDQGLHFGFHSSQPASSVVRQGSSTLGVNSFGSLGTPRPGGITRATATFDLRLVPIVVPPGVPSRLVYDRDHASITPFQPRRGSRMRAALTNVRLVDARGTAVATSGTGGCDVAFVAGNEVRLSKRSIAGTWTPSGLSCAWQVPRQGPIATAIATRNVQVRVAPWVLYGGKRYWAYPKGNHFLFIKFVERD